MINLISRKLKDSYLMGGFDVAQHFQLLLKAINAKKVIELGCYSGFTTLSMAMALPPDGQVISCDISDKYVAYDIWRNFLFEFFISAKEILTSTESFLTD
jgi:predicted O-methyltransferase YrrM